MPILNWPDKIFTPITPQKLFIYGDVFPQGNGYPNEIPDSHLFLGENKNIMASLLPEYKEQIDLIYADPPFFTNKKFQTRIGRGEDSRKPSDWKLEKGYSDHWNNLDDYLSFLYTRLNLMHQLLSPTGTLYLHLDWHADSYARILLDEIFGSNRLINQVAWIYHGPSPIKNAFNRKHDTIFIYSKSGDYTFNCDDVREPYHPNTVKTFASSVKAGFGKQPNLKRGKVPEDWWYFPVVARLHNERTGYPTQKPEALLERIIKASSNPDDLVADFFSGSGTTSLVAAKLGRRYLAADASWRAFHTTRNRLTSLPASPFRTWTEKGSEPPFSRGKISAQIEKNTISIDCPDELDSWEIDPDWDGTQFKSMYQLIRPTRKGSIALTLQLPSAGERVKIRAVTVVGEMLEFVVEQS